MIAAGQANDAKSAYLSAADKIITIDGTAELTADEITAVKETPYGHSVHTEIISAR